MKKGLLALLSLFSIGLVSAARYSGSRFAPSTYFDSSFIIWGLVFIAFFALINFLLGRTMFKNDKATKTVIGLVLAILSVYGLFTLNFDPGQFHIGGWYLGEFSSTILTFIFLGIIGFLFWKFKCLAWFILSGLSFAGVFLDLVYQYGLFIFLGILFVIFGIICYSMKNKKPKKEKPLEQKSRMDILIAEAKAYKKITLKQKNPKFYQNWAQFISHLKKRGYGVNEKDIMQKLNVSQKDIQKVVKNYVL